MPSYRIGPSEVEEAINSHAAVAESAVVGWPNDLRGYVVKGFVVLKTPTDEDTQTALKKEIQEHVKGRTAPYKYPRQVHKYLHAYGI